jgi:hypothetical protein
VILAAIKAQCPQFLPAVADLMPGAAAVQLPSNVIPMHGRQRTKTAPPSFEHPDLFPEMTA